MGKQLDMDRDRRIEMEVNVATEIAKTLFRENERYIGRPRRFEADIPNDAAWFAHEIVEKVLRNNLGQDE
jgi:hypothetical protein